MLDLLRRHAGSWLIKVALFLIVVVFIFWGGYSYKIRQENQIARVGDSYISIAEYQEYYNQILENYRRQLGESFSEEMMRRLNLKQQALNSLINRYVIVKAADELGLTATDQEIQQKLLEYPVFQTEGRFDQKRYILLLRQNRLTPEGFERQVGQDLTVEKVESFIKNTALVTRDEIQADFQFNNTEIQICYATFDPQSFEKQVNIDAQALETFYKNNEQRYRDVEKRRISAVLFKPEDYSGGVQISEDQIKQYYDDHLSDYRREQEVRARHILFGLEENAVEPEVTKIREQAQKVLKEARQGKDFGELARKYSTDPGSKDRGGDLGFFKRNQMVPEFSDVAFRLKPGEISEPVRTPYGYHLIKVEEIHPEETIPFDKARKDIEAALKREKGMDVALTKAREFADLAFAQKDITKAAQTTGFPLFANGVWVAQKDPLPGLKTREPEIMDALFGLPDKGVSEVLETEEGLLVAQITAIEPPKTIPLEQIRERVEKDYRSDQGRVLAQNKASELLRAAEETGSLEAACRKHGVDLKKSEWFSRKRPDPTLGTLQGAAQNTVFQLIESRPLPSEPVLLGNRYAAVQLLGRRLPEGDSSGAWAETRNRLMEEKQMIIWETWLQEQRKLAKVEIFREL